MPRIMRLFGRRSKEQQTSSTLEASPGVADSDDSARDVVPETSAMESSQAVAVADEAILRDDEDAGDTAEPAEDAIASPNLNATDPLVADVASAPETMDGAGDDRSPSEHSVDLRSLRFSGFRSLVGTEMPLASRIADSTDESQPATATTIEAEPDTTPTPIPVEAHVTADTNASTTAVAGRRLIGGEEANIVALIPDTKPEAESQELDEETVATATVEALRGACELMVDRVNRIRALHDGAQVISAMIALVSELDAKYAEDWGVVRHNGLEELFDDARGAVPEGDRFILESLEDDRGGLTDAAFVKDLKTVAVGDQPRLIAEYALFLVFMYRRVLRQYLRPLEQEPVRQNDMAARLDYLVDGVRQVLIRHISAQVGDR